MATHAGLPRPDLIAQVQSELHIAYSETRYTQDVLRPDPATIRMQPLRHHRLRLPCEVRTYETHRAGNTSGHLLRH